MSFRKTISIVLWPLTMWYAIVVAIRNLLFDIGILRQHIPPVTTIGIGNIAAGGTGKTPMAEYLIALLGEQHETVLLSRGYKRGSRGFYMRPANSPYDENLSTYIGDEPAMIAHKFPHITAAVCKKRMAGIERLLAADNPPKLIIMDDVFQHRFVKPTLSILLTEYQRPYYKDCVLPYGNLRESRLARNRANIIVVTKSPKKINSLEKHAIINALKTKNYQKIFFSYIEYCDPKPLFKAPDIDLAAANDLLVVTGIAHPEPLLNELKQQGRHIEHLAFPDHHNFTKKDLAAIRTRFEAAQNPGRIIVTTEKDAERLRNLDAFNLLNDLPVYYIPIEVKFLDYGVDFDKIITSAVKENISFLERLSGGGPRVR